MKKLIIIHLVTQTSITTQKDCPFTSQPTGKLLRTKCSKYISMTSYFYGLERASTIDRKLRESKTLGKNGPLNMNFYPNFGLWMEVGNSDTDILPVDGGSEMIYRKYRKFDKKPVRLLKHKFAKRFHLVTFCIKRPKTNMLSYNNILQILQTPVDKDVAGWCKKKFDPGGKLFC